MMQDYGNVLVKNEGGREIILHWLRIGHKRAQSHRIPFVAS